MKAETVQMVWHAKQPVLSCDLHDQSRLVTGGADANVRIWRISQRSKESAPAAASVEAKSKETKDGVKKVKKTVVSCQDYNVDFVATLSRHSKAVNAVRFSPDGSLLASAADDGFVIVWKRSEDGTVTAAPVGDDLQNLEHWTVVHLMRTHLEDVYDLAWSPNSQYLVSGSVDNTVVVWNVDKGKNIQHIRDHKHYVQGVAWDPLNQFVATQSSDRSMIVYNIHSKKKQYDLNSVTNVSKLDLVALSEIEKVPQHTATSTTSTATTTATAAANGENNEAMDVDGIESVKPVFDNETESSDAAAPTAATVKATAEGSVAVKEKDNTSKAIRVYSDEMLQSFFRRLTFSPDGSLLFSPCGKIPLQAVPDLKAAAEGDMVNTTLVFSRAGFKPVLHLPSPKKPTVAIRCSPLLYKKWDDMMEGPGMLEATHPFRMIIAIATLDTVLLYDTQQLDPISQIENLHYAPITDLTWSNDGRLLIICSSDGYCSIVSFEENELGEPIPLAEYPKEILDARQREIAPSKTEEVQLTDASVATNQADVAVAPAPAASNAEEGLKRPAEAPAAGTEKKPRRMVPTLITKPTAVAAPVVPPPTAVEPNSEEKPIEL